jgi:hypothetical protein
VNSWKGQSGRVQNTQDIEVQGLVGIGQSDLLAGPPAELFAQLIADQQRMGFGH